MAPLYAQPGSYGSEMPFIFGRGLDTLSIAYCHQSCTALSDEQTSLKPMTPSIPNTSCQMSGQEPLSYLHLVLISWPTEHRKILKSGMIFIRKVTCVGRLRLMMYKCITPNHDMSRSFQRNINVHN